MVKLFDKAGIINFNPVVCTLFKYNMELQEQKTKTLSFTHAQ